MNEPKLLILLEDRESRIHFESLGVPSSFNWMFSKIVSFPENKGKCIALAFAGKINPSCSLRLCIIGALSVVNKPPEEQSEKERDRPSKARGAGRPANYVRNSLARVNIERPGVYTST